MLKNINLETARSEEIIRALRDGNSHARYVVSRGSKGGTRVKGDRYEWHLLKRISRCSTGKCFVIASPKGAAIYGLGVA